ncbi:MAG: M12 family metallopeptidase [Phycicoccus sp.]
MSTDRTWPGGVVPYEIDPTLPNWCTVESALRAWHDARAPVRFVPWSGDSDAEPDYVVFTPASWCAAASGRLGGRQEIQLDHDCRVGVVLHEMGHTVGMIHEHTRPDRDGYVTIGNLNIYGNARSQFFRREEYAGGTTPELPYDVGSIMHYSQMAFSTNHRPTLIPDRSVVPRPGRPLIGQRMKLSEGDLARLHNLYGGA